MMTRKTARLVFAACFGLVTGCSDSSVEQKAIVETRPPTSPLEYIKLEISNLASNVTKGCASDHKYFSDFAKRVGELPLPEREDAFKFAVESLKKPALKEYPLSDRLLSLAAYDATVSRLADVFLAALDSQEDVWDLLLRTISVFDDEIMAVNAPGFNPRNPEWGLVMPIEAYVAEAYRMHARAVHERIEDSKLFAQYYHGLSSDRQEYWSKRIEKVAHRRIDIGAEKNSYGKLHRNKTTVKRPVKPVDHEKRLPGVDLNSILRVIGIDSAEEGRSSCNRHPERQAGESF